jgi:hypothetical protein
MGRDLDWIIYFLWTNILREQYRWLILTVAYICFLMVKNMFFSMWNYFQAGLIPQARFITYKFHWSPTITQGWCLSGLRKKKHILLKFMHFLLLFVRARKALIIQNIQICITISETIMTRVNYKEQFNLKSTNPILDLHQMFKESQLFPEQVTPV